MIAFARQSATMSLMADWITTREAAELGGYTEAYLRDLVRTGRITARKFGPIWQVDRVSVRAYLRQAEKLGERRGRKRKS